jgi:hypothetical protein
MKTRITAHIGIIFVLLTLSLLASCKSDKSVDPPAGNATFLIKMGDNPAGYDAVNVEILRVTANINGTWIDYPVASPGVYNLLQFTNGNTLLLLGPTVVAPGSISELRLILGDNNSIVVDGVVCELKTPSGQTSGYKVKMDVQPLSSGVVYSLVLDFDVNKSVHPTGNGKYILKPVIRGYLETAIGKLSGNISPVNGAYYVMASNAVDTAGTYINEIDGTFLLTTLVPGTYNVHFYANQNYLDKEIPGIIITAGQTTALGTIIIDPMGSRK